MDEFGARHAGFDGSAVELLQFGGGEAGETGNSFMGEKKSGR